MSTGPRTRAPLGNKTTNAKAKASQGHGLGVKAIVREMERSQSKTNTIQKPKQKPAGLSFTKYDVRSEAVQSLEEDEPEYAPPQSLPLPYQSDVLPVGGLTFEGLKKENLLRGYYGHFYNPMSEEGVSRMEREFNNEMAIIMQTAMHRNEQEIDGLDWSVSDIPDTVRIFPEKICRAKDPTISSHRAAKGLQQQPPTMSSKQAAKSLAISPKKLVNTNKPRTTRTAVKRPMSFSTLNAKPEKPEAHGPDSVNGKPFGEVASRTTIGYTKGRSASSLLLDSRQVDPARHILADRMGKFSLDSGASSDLTITSARLRQTVLSRERPSETHIRPQFLSIFDEKDEACDLQPMNVPYQDEELEEDFELSFD